MLKLDNISIRLGEFNLNNINLSIDKGDYYVLMGKSGAGKTILLEMIAGLIIPDKGCISIDGKDITNEKIQKRKVGIVFQNYAIFTHLTVKQNIGYSLRKNKYSKAQRNKLISEYAELTEVTHLLERNASNLSGGELQRVALARTLIRKPDYLLLDEPLSSLDIQLKSGFRNLLRRFNQKGITILHVTHDYEEALALSNKVGVLHDGKIIQQGITREVFSKPTNDFVAQFTGVRNFFEVEFTEVNIAKHSSGLMFFVSNSEIHKTGKIIIRSKHIIISLEQFESSAMNSFKGKIIQTVPCHNSFEVIVDIGVILTVSITERSMHRMNLQEGKIVWVSFKANAIKIIY